MNEVWLPIKNYNYSASNLGRIKNHKFNRICKLSLHHYGYYKILIRINKKRKTCLVHRLVALAFIRNSENKPHINHKNLIKTDNRIENLEWCTRTENMQHAIKNGVHLGPPKGTNLWWKPHLKSPRTKKRLNEI